MFIIFLPLSLPYIYFTPGIFLDKLTKDAATNFCSITELVDPKIKPNSAGIGSCPNPIFNISSAVPSFISSLTPEDPLLSKPTTVFITFLIILELFGLNDLLI